VSAPAPRGSVHWSAAGGVLRARRFQAHGGNLLVARRDRLSSVRRSVQPTPVMPVMPVGAAVVLRSACTPMAVTLEVEGRERREGCFTARRPSSVTLAQQQGGGT
jgi:hypothetical protein